MVVDISDAIHEMSNSHEINDAILTAILVLNIIIVLAIIIACNYCRNIRPIKLKKMITKFDIDEKDDEDNLQAEHCLRNKPHDSVSAPSEADANSMRQTATTKFCTDEDGECNLLDGSVITNCINNMLDGHAVRNIG